MGQNIVRNNTALSRYELDVDGAIAFANYRLAPGIVVITHTETPPALRGRGIASKLVQGALEQIRADGRRSWLVADSWSIIWTSIRNSPISRLDP